MVRLALGQDGEDGVGTFVILGGDQPLIDQGLVLPDDPELARHAADAIAKHSRRGWRLDKAVSTDNIDALIALCMALERRDHQPEPARLVAWV